MDVFIGLFLGVTGVVGVFMFLFTVEEIDELVSMIVLISTSIILILGSVFGFTRLITPMPKQEECVELQIAPGFKLKGQFERPSEKIQ